MERGTEVEWSDDDAVDVVGSRFGDDVSPALCSENDVAISLVTFDGQ
jgi:hypothetical protein